MQCNIVNTHMRHHVQAQNSAVDFPMNPPGALGIGITSPAWEKHKAPQRIEHLADAGQEPAAVTLNP